MKTLAAAILLTFSAHAAMAGDDPVAVKAVEDFTFVQKAEAAARGDGSMHAYIMNHDTIERLHDQKCFQYQVVLAALIQARDPNYVQWASATIGCNR